MPDLTTCPTCGLPAELVEHSAGEATARCVLMHDFIVVLESVDIRAEEAAPEGPPASSPPGTPPAPSGNVVRLPVAPPPSREWARRAAWFCFGALAALLLTRATLAAIVLIPLTIPLIGVEAARRSWRPMVDRCAALPAAAQLIPAEPAAGEPESGENAAAA